MKLRITLLVAALACGLQLSAQDKTIYVNLETIFENFYKTINANIAFEDQKKDFEARLGLIREEMQNLEKQAQRYNEEVQNDLLPRETRETRPSPRQEARIRPEPGGRPPQPAAHPHETRRGSRQRHSQHHQQICG